MSGIRLAENADSLINDVKAAKADSVRMSLEKNLIFARFGKHAHAPWNVVNTNVERKVSLMEDTAKVRKLFESGRSMYKLEHTAKISKLERESQQLTSIVMSKHLE